MGRLVIWANMPVALLWGGPRALGEEFPSHVVVIVGAARIQVDTQTVGTALLGECLSVRETRGEWAWVEGGGRAGWIRRREVTPDEQAIEWFTAQIKQQPADARLFQARAKAWERRGEAEIALGDFSEAVRLAPKDVALRIDRGQARLRSGQRQQALADFHEALRLEPASVRAYSARASAWYFEGEYAKAIGDYQQAIRLQPDLPLVHNNLAWLLATCPDEQFRDGPRAVAEAQRACELDDYRTHWYLGTLAAAQAEAGDYRAAQQWQSKALALTPMEGQERADALARLELYRASQAYREYEPQLQTTKRPQGASATKTR